MILTGERRDSLSRESSHHGNRISDRRPRMIVVFRDFSRARFERAAHAFVADGKNRAFAEGFALLTGNECRGTPAAKGPVRYEPGPDDFNNAAP
jgi:hypothetical protein